MRTRSGSISNHYYGRAADIFFVDGVPVTGSNEAARQVVAFLAGLKGQVRASEVGHPFADISFVGGFTDSDHDDHVHIAFD